MSIFFRWIVTLAIVCVVSDNVFAIGREGIARPDLELRRMQKPSDAIGALGNDLFGDQTDFDSGQTSFSATDIDLPGNSALPVSLSRSLSVDEFDGYLPAQGMGRWTIDVPAIEGVFADRVGWVSDDPQFANSRCSKGSGAPPAFIAPEGGQFLPEEYWQGMQLKIPGLGAQSLLRSTTSTQNRATPARWTTADRWLIDCLPTLKNGVAGEGFVATAPNGNKYFFDLMIVKPSFAPMTRIKRLVSTFNPTDYCGIVRSSACDVQRINNNNFYLDSGGIYRANELDGTGGGGTGGPGTSSTYSFLYRDAYFLVATRVEDRFGNWVAYDYNTNNKLAAIRANDGRNIQLTYGTTHAYPLTATANGRVWTYQYDDTNNLIAVVQADGRAWRFASTGAMSTGYMALYNDSEVPFSACSGYQLNGQMTGQSAEIAYGLSITHPSGALGKFDFVPRLHGKSHAIGCEQAAVVNLAIIKKQITGAGITPATWQYEYGP